jgi:hypothetical protein
MPKAGSSAVLMALVVGEAKGSAGEDFGWFGYVEWGRHALMRASLTARGPYIWSEGRQRDGVKGVGREEGDGDIAASTVDGCGAYFKAGEERGQQ